MIETERLILRQWREADRAPFATLNADPQVRRHFPSVLTRAESDVEMDRIASRLESDGTTFWALERKVDGAFLGFAGVVNTRPPLPFEGAPEVGWRLARAHWGKGYASSEPGAPAARLWSSTDLGLRRDRQLHRHHQPAVASGDGAYRHDANSRARLRPSRPAGRSSSAPPRGLDAGAALAGGRRLYARHPEQRSSERVSKDAPRSRRPSTRPLRSLLRRTSGVRRCGRPQCFCIAATVAAGSPGAALRSGAGGLVRSHGVCIEASFSTAHWRISRDLTAAGDQPGHLHPRGFQVGAEARVGVQGRHEGRAVGPPLGHVARRVHAAHHAALPIGAGAGQNLGGAGGSELGDD